MSDFVIDTETLLRNRRVEADRIRRIQQQLAAIRASGIAIDSGFRLSAALGDLPLNLNNLLAAKSPR
jgi:hypothetical protein